MSANKTNGSGGEYDAIIVGAGFAGVYAVYKLRGMGLRVRALEAGDDIGGTWFWNRYPGARCDVESMQYSYQFSEELQQDWNWSQLYAPQPEILNYIHHVADRFDLRRDIQTGTRVRGASYDEASARWTIETETGARFEARYLVMATGCLSIPLVPDIDGLDAFGGPVLRTSDWPADGVDLAGKRVGIVGTGSSAIQAVPHLAEEAAYLAVFQRTPNYSIPAHNRPMDETYERLWKDNYADRRRRARATRNNTMNAAGDRSGLEFTPEQLEAELESRWAVGGIAFMYAFTDMVTNERVNEVAGDFVRRKIAETVRDPETARKLTPREYPLGTKRICVDSHYFETFNRDNVELVDIKDDPIERVTASGVRLEGGREIALDALALATGFDAMTGPLMNIDLTGRGGLKIQQPWAEGPQTYFGLMVAGFPNMFVVAGPGSPSVFSNMVTSAEQHVDWLAEAIATLHDRGASAIEAEPEAQAGWVEHCRELAGNTLFDRANSWYVGANVKGKPRVFAPYIGGVANYLEQLEDATADGYRGFKLS